MADSHDENCSEPESTKDTPMDEGDDNEHSTDKITKNAKIQQEMADLLTQEREPMNIRYEIPVRRGKSLDESLQLHLQLLHHLDKAFRKQDLMIYDKKLQRVTNFTAPKWLENDYYDSHFDHCVDNDRKTITLTHQIYSTVPLAIIKEDPTIAEFLVQSNTYLRDQIQSTQPNAGYPIPPVQDQSNNATKMKAKDKTNQNATTSNTSKNMTRQKPTDDDASETTIPTGKTSNKAKTFIFEMIEISIRFEITLKNDNDRGVHLRHAATLRSMEQAFKEEEFEIIDNHNRRVTLQNYPTWTKLEHYKKHFKIHTLPGKKGRQDKYYVIHRVRTTLALATIRNDRKVFSTLQENDVYLRRHFFKEDEWDLVNLGFILEFDPSKYLRDDARKMVLELAKNEECLTQAGERFQLVAGTPFTYLSGNKYTTKAYTIQCLRNDSRAVDEMLKKTYHSTCCYVKFRMQRSNKQAFAKAIQAMNQYLNTIRVIPVVGITRIMMQELGEKIHGIEGIFDVIPAKSTEINGRWNIITDSHHFYATLKLVRTNLLPWIETLHTSDEPPAEFPTIRVTARVNDDNDDESSDGEQSYLSTSALSYGSFQSTGSADYRPPEDSYSKSSSSQRQRTYASAAALSGPITRPSLTPRNVQEDNRSSVSAMTSPATLPIEFQLQFQEMEAKLKLIPEMESKMQRLETMITQLLGLSVQADQSNTNTITPRETFHAISAKTHRPVNTTTPHPPAQEIPPALQSPPRYGYRPSSELAGLSNSPKELFAPNGDGTMYSVGFHKPRPNINGLPPPLEGKSKTTTKRNRKGNGDEIDSRNDPKRKDQRDTPTKSNGNNEAMNTSPTDEGPFIQVRRHKNRIFNPYKEEAIRAGRDNHDAVRRARPTTWSANNPNLSPSLPAVEAQKPT